MTEGFCVVGRFSLNRSFLTMHGIVIVHVCTKNCKKWRGSELKIGESGIQIIISIKIARSLDLGV
jgi:hypothetical protein